ncbi:MAG: PAS domain S-box protein [Methylovulum sp.]|nr:PAS domain S-box protein [Methylovulum sp.]
MDSITDKHAFNIIIVEWDESNSALIIPPLIKQINANAASLLGYAEAELVDKPLAILFAPENIMLSPGGFLALRDKGVVSELMTKAGELVPVRLFFTVLSGRLQSATDVALQVQVLGSDNGAYASGKCGSIESALAESEERFRQMAEMTGEWLWEQDPQGFYIYSSTAVNQILGYSQNEVIGKHYTHFLTAHDQASQQCYAGNQQPFYGLTNHYRHKNGHLVFTESTGLPLFDVGGKLLKWRGVDRDITAQKHFHDALIESEKRTRLIIESSMNAIVIMDAYGIITDWNLQSEKMFGWSAEEAIGFRLEELIIPPRFHDSYRQGLKLFLHTGICPLLNQMFEHVALRRGGAEFPVEVSVSPLKLGHSYIFSGFIHDITARKAAEQQIRQAQIDLAITQSEINIAQKIQVSLLPDAPIKSSGFEVVGVCMPADQIGGDYFDYFFRDEDHLDMVIADVSGHSIGPALFMVEARSAIRTHAKRLGTVSEMLGLLNDFLFEDLNKADYFITLFYLQYDIINQQLSFANAGHPPPLLLGAGQANCQALDAEGLILGIRKNIVFEEKTLALSGGDLVLVYTDGLTEAENPAGEFFGLARVSDAFIRNAQCTPEQIIKAILAELKQFCSKETFNDDITLMVFKRA